MKSKFLILIAAVMVFSVNDLFALTYLGGIEGIGDPVLSVTGRTLGMGNTAVAASRSIDAVFYNPAGMLKSRRGGIGMGFGVYPIKETITLDDESTVYSSENYYEFSNVSMMLPLGSAIRFGVGYRPLLDMNYSNSKNTYDSAVITGISNYDKTGGVNETLIALAVGARPVYLGFDYGILNGKASYDTREIVVESTKDTGEGRSNYSGGLYRIGGIISVKREVADIGFTWIFPYKLENKWDSTNRNYIWADEKWPYSPDSTSISEAKTVYDFPSQLAVGLNYEFYQFHRSVISVDVVTNYWKDYKYEVIGTTCTDINDPNYRNTSRISVGVEHFLGVDTVLRFGFTHMPHYSRTTCDTTMFTVGAGFAASKYMDIDIACVYGKRNFYGKNVYYTTDEMVDERIAKIMVSAVWRFSPKRERDSRAGSGKTEGEY